MTVNALPNASIPEFLTALIERARAVDGQRPFSDQSLVELVRAERTLLGSEQRAAIFSANELELVVDPDHRGQGLGGELVTTVLREHPDAAYAWAHGDHPASRALARRFSFTPVRTLLQLRATLGSPNSPFPEEVAQRLSRREPAISPFRPGDDDSAWLVLNAKAFADHPEQGGLTQRDLDDRMAEPWFNADDFLILRDGGDMIGFCWLKVEDDIGEIYAVGMDPARQGEGLGRVLMDAGLARMAAHGIRTVALYVEADNVPALALYQRYGFTQHTIDIRYQRTDR